MRGAEVDAVRGYVRAHAKAIRSRTPQSPVVVVLDWDAAGKRQEFQRYFAAGDPFHALSWQEKLANPRLDRSFRGIERFYPDRIIDQACAVAPDLVGVKKNGTLCVAGDFGKLKKAAWEIVRKGLAAEDLKYARPFLDELVLVAGIRETPVAHVAQPATRTVDPAEDPGGKPALA